MTRFVLTTCLALASVAGALATPDVRVTVKPSSDIAGEIVPLGVLASVESSDEGLARKVGEVTVCQSPMPGMSRRVLRQQIQTAIRRAGVDDSSFTLVCPGEIRVKRLATTVTGEELFEVVRRLVAEEEGWPGEAIAEPVRVPDALSLPLGKLELRAKSGPVKLHKGRNSVSVEVLVDDQVCRTIPVQVNIRVLARVVVAERAIRRNEPLDTSSVSVETRDITTLPNDILIGDPAPEWIASTTIPAGSVLKRSWVTTPPAIRSGDPVLVQVDAGAVIITDKGRAMQDGRIGDRIKVKLGKDSRQVRGLVDSEGLIKITIGRGR